METLEIDNSQIWANGRAKVLLARYTKTELAKAIGISRPTLNERLHKGNWKKSEIIALGQL